VRTAGTLAEPVSGPAPHTTALAAGAEASPLTPASTAVWVFAAVVLGVEVSPELETVVTPTHQSSSAASVAVMLTSVIRSVTVSLANITGTLWSAAPPPLVVPAAALLALRRLQPDSGYYWCGWLALNCGGFLTAVVLGVIVETKLEAVVGAAHQVSSTASVSIVSSAIIRAVTVSLSLLTGILWSAAAPSSVVPPGTSLACRRLQGHRADHRGGDFGADRDWLDAAVIFRVEERTELFTIVVTTDQASSAVTIYLAVSLSFRAGILWSATRSREEIPSLAGSSFGEKRNWLWLDAAVIFLMEERSELFTVVVTTDQASSAVTIYLAVSLSFRAGILRCAAWSGEEIPSLASSNFWENWLWFDTAVIFRVEERSELFTIIVTTDQASSAVTIYLAISLTFRAGILRGAAWSREEISPFAPLERFRFPEFDHAVNCFLHNWRQHQWVGLLLTAVIFLMIIRSKLLTVVTTTHQLSLAARVTIVLTPVTWAVTVSLSLVTGLQGSATPPPSLVIPPSASLSWWWV